MVFLKKLLACCSEQILEATLQKTAAGHLPPISQTNKDNITVTNLPSRKLSKLGEPDIQDTAGEAGTSS